MPLFSFNSSLPPPLLHILLLRLPFTSFLFLLPPLLTSCSLSFRTISSYLPLPFLLSFTLSLSLHTSILCFPPFLYLLLPPSFPFFSTLSLPLFTSYLTAFLTFFLIFFLKPRLEGSSSPAAKVSSHVTCLPAYSLSLCGHVVPK